MNRLNLRQLRRDQVRVTTGRDHLCSSFAESFRSDTPENFFHLPAGAENSAGHHGVLG